MLQLIGLFKPDKFIHYKLADDGDYLTNQYVHQKLDISRKSNKSEVYVLLIFIMQNLHLSYNLLIMSTLKPIYLGCNCVRKCRLLSLRFYLKFT